MLGVVKRSLIFDEFTPDEQDYHFSIKEKAVSHHIDSLYYSVFIEGDKVGNGDVRLMDLLAHIHERKQVKLQNMAEDIQFFGLSVGAFGAAVSGGMYMNRLSYAENFDVFITDYIPNDNTPRIQVQIRTRSLVLDGLYGAVEASYNAVKNILDHYGLVISDIQENRIDYAFHTNLIQKPMEMFSDESLQKHLITSYKQLWKHIYIPGRKDKFFDLDYFALGTRKANNVFFRAYAKAKEVVQQNYKSFFFEIWRQRGLISRYDQFVYEKAYEMKSFKTGCLVGRIEWYLQYGKDEARKAELRKLLLSCNIKSDNNPRIEEEIKGVLPPVTVVLNLEFETKRKFYLNLGEFIAFSKYKHDGSEVLRRLYKVLSLRREIVNHLFTEVVSFVEDRWDADSGEMDFWKRLRRVRINDQPDKSALDAFYTYSRNIDVRRSKRAFASNLASLAMINRNDVSEATFSEDLFEAISLLNDNDIHNFDRKIFDEFADVAPASYKFSRMRKGRQLRSILNKRNMDRQAAYVEIDSDVPLIEIAERQKQSEKNEKDNYNNYVDYVFAKTKAGDSS